MATNYTLLTGTKTTSGSIRNWVNSDVPAEDIISKAEKYLCAHLRVKSMQYRLSFTILVGEDQFTLPDDFLDPDGLWIDEHGEVEYEQDGVYFESIRSTDAMTPAHFTLIGDHTILLDCPADEEYAAVLWYYASPDPLSNLNQTNLFTDRLEVNFHHALLGFAYQHLKDEQRASTYLQLALADSRVTAIMDDLKKRGMRIRGGVRHG